MKQNLTDCTNNPMHMVQNENRCDFLVFNDEKINENMYTVYVQ